MSLSCSKDFTVTLEHGLHIQPISLIVKSALQYTCSVTVENLDEKLTADGKSVFSMMLLKAAKGSHLRVTTEGEDSEAAMNEIMGLVESDFGEK